MEKFISFINSYSTLSDSAEQAIKEFAIVENLKKGSLISEEGKTCRRLYFLMEGTVRTFFYQNGKDVTHWIYPENTIVTSWYSYISQTHSKDYIETTEDSKVVFLTYEQWQNLYQKFPELERFGRLIMEEQMALLDDFYKGYYLLSAKEKYELLNNAYPDITLRANLGHIASILGISQETLSRIRANS